MRYRFADLTLDIDRGALERSGEAVRLRPKVFDVLAYLIEHSDRPVSKDELLQEVWPQRYVSESTLSSCLKELRQAVGDSGREQQVIQTVPKRGYRFVAPFEIQDDNQSDGVSDNPAAPASSKQTSSQEPISAAASRPDQQAARSQSSAGEHKIVSVLSCALNDAAGVAEQLGAEDMDRFMRAFLTTAQTVIKRFDGYVTQWSGDGFIVLFGARQAHDDHARRAVLAALELIRRRPAIAKNDACGFCIGIHSGPAVISHLQDDPQQIYTALGATTGTAEQLRREAGTDAPLISAATYEFVQADVLATPVGSAADANASAFRVERILSPHAGVPRRVRRTLTPFVGRSQELALLTERLRHAREDHGQIVSIIGEPGIGKSRLLQEFRASLDKPAVDFYQAHCFSHGVSTPYLPVLSLLRQLCAIIENTTPGDVVARLRRYLASAQIGDEEALPLLLQLFDIPYDAVPLKRFSPQAQRERTLRLLRRLVLHASRPRIIAIEDLHWIDATSQEWLASLVAQTAGASLLLLLTYRPNYRPPWLGLSHTTQLVLPPLTHEDSLRLVRSLPHSSKPAKHLQALVAKGGGNPFFLEELARSNNPQRNTMPDTVQGVLAARIDALPAGDKEVLRTAAVIGVHIPYVLLAAVADCGQAELDISLSHLQDADLLFEDYTAAQDEYAFKHILAQEVAYRSLLSEQRRLLHARIADILETQFKETSFYQPNILAHHYSEAGQYRRAADYWQQAGRHAYEHSAYDETIDYVQKGLSALDHVPDNLDRERQELRLQTTLGPALMAAKGYAAPEVESVLTRARALCEQLDDNAALFRVLIGLSNYYWVGGRFGQAYDTNRRVLKLARAGSNSAGLLRAHAAMGELLVHAGRLRAARRHIARGMHWYLAQDRHTFATQTPAVACFCYAAWQQWQLGYDDRALEHAQKALALARELAHPFCQAIALSLIAELHQFRLDMPKTLELAQAGADLAREQGYPFWESTALVLLGWARAQSGRSEQGIETVRRGLALFRTTHAEVQLSSWYGLLAESYACNAQFDKGLEAVAKAFTWVEKTNERYYEAELYRLRGCLLLKQGHAQAAQEAFNRAMQLAGQRAMRIWQLRAACDLAQLWQNQGKRDAALKLLEPLYGDFSEGFEAPDLRRARRMLGA